MVGCALCVKVCCSRVAGLMNAKHVRGTKWTRALSVSGGFSSCGVMNFRSAGLVIFFLFYFVLLLLMVRKNVGWVAVLIELCFIEAGFKI